MKFPIAATAFLLLSGCSSPQKPPAEPTEISPAETRTETRESAFEMVVLGTAQDAGYPQIGCQKACCAAYWNGSRNKENVTCLGIIDRSERKSWLVEATPDIISEWQLLQNECPECEISGILITHAHIGHYTGLMHLGREAMGGQRIPVYVMPKMRDFLSTNGPWSQLIELENIDLVELENGMSSALSRSISVTPRLVPHRDEFSETVGFEIKGPEKQLLFIPDIDKWEKWDRDILNMVPQFDYACLDGTFFNANELPGRDMSEIPHPFVVESMSVFDELEPPIKSRIHFIHFNHTNPLLNPGSAETTQVQNRGFSVAFSGLHFPL